MYVYKIYSLLGDKCYIGSTTKSLNERFSNHKWDYKRWKQGKINKITSFDLFEEYKPENCCIELLEEVNDISQLKIREQYWIDNTENTVNNFRAIFIDKERIKEYQKEYKQTHKEYYNQLKKEWAEKNKDKKKQYYEQNKQQINNKKKQYYQNNKEDILKNVKEYRENNKNSIKEYKKEYYKNNLEYFKEYRKERYENNKEQLSQKIQCECGDIVSKGSLSRHKKRQVHINKLTIQ